MTYDELCYLISQVNDDIESSSKFIFPYSNNLKNREQVPDTVIKKLRYKDACIYFLKDLKEELNGKKMGIEKAFFNICREKMEEEEFNSYFGEAEKISTGV